MMVKQFLILMICMLLLFLSGCWDRIEIEERGFVIGAGIDKGKREEYSITKGENEKLKDLPYYKLTYQMVIPSTTQPGGGGQDGGGGANPYVNLSAQGHSLYKIQRTMPTKINATPYLQQLRMIIISEDTIKKEGIGKILDFYFRDNEMRRPAKVLIAKGKAKDLLEIVPTNEKLPVMYIQSILNNHFRTFQMIHPVTIGDMHTNVLEYDSFVIPAIEKIKNEVVIKGAAIIDGSNDRLLGYFTETETEGYNILSNAKGNGAFEFLFEGSMAAIEMQEIKTDIKARVSGDKITFDVYAYGTGVFKETSVTDQFYSEEKLKEVEKVAEKYLKDVSESAIKKMKETNADVLKLKDTLKRKDYKQWKKVEKNWEHGENYFRKSEVNVNIDLDIVRSGITNRTKRKES